MENEDLASIIIVKTTGKNLISVTYQPAYDIKIYGHEANEFKSMFVIESEFSGTVSELFADLKNYWVCDTMKRRHVVGKKTSINLINFTI